MNLNEPDPTSAAPGEAASAPPTPRTDAHLEATRTSSGPNIWATARFARQLEREVEEWKSYYQNTHAEFFKQQQALATAEAKVRDAEDRVSWLETQREVECRQKLDAQAETEIFCKERDQAVADLAAMTHDEQTARACESEAVKELATANARIAELEKERDEWKCLCKNATDTLNQERQELAKTLSANREFGPALEAIADALGVKATAPTMASIIGQLVQANKAFSMICKDQEERISVLCKNSDLAARVATMRDLLLKRDNQVQKLQIALQVCQDEIYEALDGSNPDHQKAVDLASEALSIL